MGKTRVEEWETYRNRKKHVERHLVDGSLDSAINTYASLKSSVLPTLKGFDRAKGILGSMYLECRIWYAANQKVGGRV